MNRQTTRWLRSVLMAAALASLLTTTANAQDQLWLRQFGTSERESINAVAPDGTGGVMIAGGANGYPNAALQAFLARYDRAGNQLWMRQIGTNEGASARALASDGVGGVMVAGSISAGGGRNPDLFVARYDSAGNQVWNHQFGSGDMEFADALAPVGRGGVVVVGRTTGSLGGPSAGDRDAWLARYDNAGNQLWIRQFGSSMGDYARAVASDGAGGVFIAGDTWGSLGRPNAGWDDGFVTRYDGEGNQLWIRQFGTSDGEGVGGVAPDGEGGVILAGWTRGDLGGPNAGVEDAILARYDGAGNQLWIRQFGTISNDWAVSVAPDGAGGVMVAGSTHGSLGGRSAGGSDIFLTRYDGLGNQVWIHQFGSSENDWARALMVPDGSGDMVVAGSTDGSLGGPNAGLNDAFLARFGNFACYHADCDQSTGVGVLDMLDFLCFQAAFMNGEPYACDCDTSTGPGVCDLIDFICFQDAFVRGCP